MPRRVPASVRELIAMLGGIERVRAVFDLTPQAVSNWIAVNMIPARYHARMLMLTEREGLFWRPPGWDPAVQLRYRPDDDEDQAA